ncbi:MAG: tripartite tricarboxylate transporter substrate binding protein [Hyphomicrobiaceae bacterium]
MSATVFLFAAAVAAVAQEGASRPIEIIVPWGQSGGADKVARKIATLIEPGLGPLRITNVPGASGQKGLAQLKAAPADGRTLAILTGDTFGVLATRQTDVRLDNLVPVAILMRQTSAFLVSETGRFKSWSDIVAAAKAANVRVAIAGPSHADELMVNYFVRQGLRLVSVPFAKPGERHRAILGGYAEVLYEQVGDVRSFVDNKQIRPILLFSRERDPRLKDVPASGELGFDVALPQFRALVVRTGTDPRAVTRLRTVVADAIKAPDYAAFLEEQYADAEGILTPEAADAFLRDELANLRKLAAAQDAMVGR